MVLILLYEQLIGEIIYLIFDSNAVQMKRTKLQFWVLFFLKQKFFVLQLWLTHKKKLGPRKLIKK